MAGTCVCSPLTGTSASNFLYQHAASKCVPTQLTKTAWWECHSTVSTRPDLNRSSLRSVKEHYQCCIKCYLRIVECDSHYMLGSFIVQQIVLHWWARSMWTEFFVLIYSYGKWAAGRERREPVSHMWFSRHLVTILILYWHLCILSKWHNFHF